jgi:tripartite-type tricarboxylate transporter receptor subunit TctC
MTRWFTSATVALAFALLPSAPVAAQEWPQRPIRILVGFGPGGGTDLAARTLAQPLSELLGQPVVVENKPGAGGTTAGELVAKSAKDGYTALMMSNAHAVSAALYKTVPYDAVNDFQMVSLVGTAGLVLVTRPDFPPSDVKGVIAALKASPDTFNYGSAGIGTTQQLASELMAQLAGFKVKHIPYRSTPAVIAALRAKEIDYTFELIQPVLGQIRSGDLKAIAVTSAQRFPTVPELPTFAEGGLPTYDVTSWYGVALPAGTPKPIVDKFHKGMMEALGRESVRKQILDAGALYKTSTPDELSSHVAREIAKWKAVMEKSGIPQQ